MPKNKIVSRPKYGLTIPRYNKWCGWVVTVNDLPYYMTAYDNLAYYLNMEKAQIATKLLEFGAVEEGGEILFVYKKDCMKALEYFRSLELMNKLKGAE